ncbi:MAG: hypothetical protein MJ223_03585 [Mycoplasmoidaceae bacterium]|nr:hypothetical protein [Mycoplasmoidaceae bacterium]
MKKHLTLLVLAIYLYPYYKEFEINEVDIGYETPRPGVKSKNAKSLKAGKTYTTIGLTDLSTETEQQSCTYGFGLYSSEGTTLTGGDISQYIDLDQSTMSADFEYGGESQHVDFTLTKDASLPDIIFAGRKLVYGGDIVISITISIVMKQDLDNAYLQLAYLPG